MEKRSHIIQSIHNFKDIENQVNLDINRIARNNFQLIKPKVTCVIINGNNNQLISSIKKEMKIFLKQNKVPGSKCRRSIHSLSIHWLNK